MKTLCRVIEARTIDVSEKFYRTLNLTVYEYYQNQKTDRRIDNRHESAIQLVDHRAERKRDGNSRWGRS